MELTRVDQLIARHLLGRLLLYYQLYDYEDNNFQLKHSSLFWCSVDGEEIKVCVTGAWNEHQRMLIILNQHILI